MRMGPPSKVCVPLAEKRPFRSATRGSSIVPCAQSYSVVPPPGVTSTRRCSAPQTPNSTRPSVGELGELQATIDAKAETATTRAVLLIALTSHNHFRRVAADSHPQSITIASAKSMTAEEFAE